ncbi:hypothetical protein [Methyloferula stellata]|uniref:hypothetical protein n=1 Tax=Methyloferula stellata TaxID=876270 RepID=UPI000363CB00|nr:hypothetical protein [Methyloferula stellata]
MAKIILKAGVAVSLVLYSASFASAQIQHRHYHAHHVYARHRAFDPSAQTAREAMPLPYEAYAARGYGGVPENPLIPIRPEVPPPVDPNEPASGSYGAMLEGRNPANTTP